MKRVVAALIILTSSAGRAQPGDAEVGGYVKYLFSREEMPPAPSSFDHILHARLNTKWFPAENLSGALELRARVYAGPVVTQTPGFADQLGHDAGFGKLGVVLWNAKESVAYGEIDRLYLNWAPARWQLTVGRQRIAWGTNLVWNPIDLFNPLSVLDVDYEERPAVDAVRAQYYTGEVSKVEAAIKPGTPSSRSISAAQWMVNRWEYDFHFLGGLRGKDWFAGTGWAGDILGGGFRGEMLASRVQSASGQPASAGIGFTGALSGDYTLPNSLYIHTEVLYSSEGVVSDAALFRPRAQALGLLTPSRWSIYQGFGYDVSPLVRAELFAIYNPLDRSFVVVPSSTWSVETNLDLSLFALFFSGASPTEFGQLGTAAYLRLKWSF